MRRRLAPYSVELTIALLGAVAAALEAILVRHADLALLVAVTSALLALAVAAIRQDLARLVGADSPSTLIERIKEPRWRKHAEAELDRLRKQLLAWADGQRKVPVKESLTFQVSELKHATSTICAIHVALDPDSLAMLSDTQKGFRSFLEAFRDLSPSIERRRVIVLDEADRSLSKSTAGTRRIISDNLIRVCDEQRQPVDKGGLGFTLRILWVPPRDRSLSDLLIIDDRVVCSIDSFGNGHFGDLEVCVNPRGVDDAIRRFENVWAESVPVEKFLP